MADRSDFQIFVNKLDDAKEVETELLHDTVELHNSLIETQVDTLLPDTEVLDDLDSVESSERELMDGYDTEVVPDSDDEVLDTTDSIGFSSRSGSFAKRVAGDLNKVDSNSHYPCKQQKDSNVNNDACGDEGHVSGQVGDMTVFDGNNVIPVTVLSGIQASDLHFTGGEIIEFKNQDLANSNGCNVDFSNNCKQLEVDGHGKLSQLKTRNVSIVYTRRKNRTTCNFKDKGVEQETRSPNNTNECAGLSYVESQEPEDISKALLFVDQYVSVNALQLSPVATVAISEKSPPELSSKGAQNLVRSANVRNRARELGIFEWDHSQDSEGQLYFRGKKYDQKYARRSPSVRDMISKEHGNPSSLCKKSAETLNNNEELTDFSHLDEKSEVYDFQKVRETKKIHETKAREEYDAVHESEDVVDVGIDTQIAAEAIQALSYADQCPHEVLERSLRGNQKRFCAGIWSFPKKARSKSRAIVSRSKDSSKISCSNNQKEIKYTKKTKVKRSKEVNIDGFRGNLNYPVAGTLKSSSLYNVDKDIPDDKRKDRGIVDNMLEVLDQKENYPRIRCENFRNARNTRVSEEDKTHTSVYGKIDQMETVLYDKGRQGGTSANLLGVSGLMENHSKLPCIKPNDARTENWCARDYPRGKRRRKILLGHSEGSCDLDYSSVKVTMEEHNHHFLRNPLNSESCCNSSSLGSYMKKRRSSVYISPCSTSSQKGGNLSLLPKENLKSPDSSYASSPNSPMIITDRNFINVIDGYDEQSAKKKASTSPLTRELVRLGFNESMPEFTSNDSRRRKTMAYIRALLSQNLDEGIRKQQKKILTRLCVPMASCPSDATHFITDKFARTRNMLEFIAQGKPVVTHMWLESCQQAGFYIDEKNYILRDVKKEEELGFRLPISLDRAREHPLLKGYRVLITPNIKPGKEMLTSLVKAAQGEVVDMPMNHVMRDKMTLDDLLILSCEEDRAYCVPFLETGLAAYSPELLLNGIIIQKLELQRHQLFTNHVNGN